MRRFTHSVIVLITSIALSGCGSGGALSQFVSAAFSPQAAVSDLQIKGSAIGGVPVSSILAALLPKPPSGGPDSSGLTPPSSDGFPESAAGAALASAAAPAVISDLSPELTAILSTALDEKYILEVGLLGQKKVVRLVCSGKEEVDKCMKIPPNAPVRASVVPLDGNLYDLRRIVED